MAPAARSFADTSASLGTGIPTERTEEEKGWSAPSVSDDERRRERKRTRLTQSVGTGGGVHPQFDVGRDVVLQEQRNPMKGASGGPVRSLGVQTSSDGEDRVARSGLDDRPQEKSGMVVLGGRESEEG